MRPSVAASGSRPAREAPRRHLGPLHAGWWALTNLRVNTLALLVPFLLWRRLAARLGVLQRAAARSSRYLAAGMDDYLTKPFHTDELSMALRRWVDDKRVPMEAAGSDTDAVTGRDANRTADGVLDEAALETIRRLQRPGQPYPLAELLAMFLDSTPQRLADMRAAVEGADGGRLATTAHTLKGEAAMVGAREVRAGCAKLERLGRSKDLFGAAALLETLDAAFVRARAVLQQQQRLGVSASSPPSDSAPQESLDGGLFAQDVGDRELSGVGGV